MLNRGPTPRGILDPELLALSTMTELTALVDAADVDVDKDVMVGGCWVRFSGGTVLLLVVEVRGWPAMGLVAETATDAGRFVEVVMRAEEGRLERVSGDFAAVGAAEAVDAAATDASAEGRETRPVAVEESEERVGDAVGEFEMAAARGVG
jgi:hypothetical protein